MTNNTTKGKEITVSLARAEDIFDATHEYKNSKKQIVISAEYRDFISLLAELYKINMSQIVNNMLRPYFDNEEFMRLLKSMAGKKHKERMKMFNDD
ncbi:hypothetical protein FACS189452_09300 [Bacteroidia bacterium]|nr:hypothetical protein FACS189452_09300 [Bacteroidia bacterium]